MQRRTERREAQRDVIVLLQKIIHAASFWRNLLRWSLYVMLVLCLMLLEQSVLPHFRWMGAQAMLLYGAIAGIAFYEDARWIGIFGGIIGLLSGILSGETVLYLPLTLAACGYFCSEYSQILFRHRFLTWLFTLLIGLGIQSLVTSICLAVGWWEFAPLAILGIAGRELLLSLFICVFLYFPISLIARIRAGRKVY